MNAFDCVSPVSLQFGMTCDNPVRQNEEGNQGKTIKLFADCTIAYFYNWRQGKEIQRPQKRHTASHYR